jgi:hypothetical protein
MRAARDVARTDAVQLDPLALSHTDWLRRDLTISGPAGDVTVFAAAVAGAGLVPRGVSRPRPVGRGSYAALRCCHPMGPSDCPSQAEAS